MHPEIKKFWEDAGYEVDNGWWRSSTVDFILKSKNGMAGAAASRKHNTGIVQYIFNGLHYTEEQMLRIIRLKAFF